MSIVNHVVERYLGIKHVLLDEAVLSLYLCVFRAANPIVIER